MFGNLPLFTTTVTSLLYILAVTTITTTQAFNLKCSATANDLTFTVTNTTSPIQNIKFKHKTPNLGDPWILQSNCMFREGQDLVCPNKDRATRPQSFRIELQLSDNTNAFRELWYYDCYKQHGVTNVNLTHVAWNKFTIVWNHYDIDAIFMKEDVINITNKDTGEHVHRQKNNQKNAQTYTYDNTEPNTNYTVCVRAKFFGFLKGSTERVTKEKCVDLTTRKEPIDNRTKEKGTDLKTPLLAVGIGILCLVLLCLLFIIYNKKCKQGGDHDYDMNKQDALMVEGGEGANGGGEEMQVYKDGEGANGDIETV